MQDAAPEASAVRNPTGSFLPARTEPISIVTGASSIVTFVPSTSMIASPGDAEREASPRALTVVVAPSGTTT